MRPISTVISVVALVAVLAPSPASAQVPGGGNLTQDSLASAAAEFGGILRFRQLADTQTLGKGRADIGVQFATASVDEWRGPRVAGRFGLNERVDIGAWGGLNRSTNAGLVGADTRIALFNESATMPVSISVRPSISAIVGTSEVWAASLGVDLTVSRAFGRVSPYAGIAATSSIALERSTTVTLDPATAGDTLAYAGVSYQWRAVVLSGEVERGNKTSYAFRLGTRF